MLKKRSAKLKKNKEERTRPGKDSIVWKRQNISVRRGSAIHIHEQLFLQAFSAYKCNQGKSNLQTNGKCVVVAKERSILEKCILFIFLRTVQWNGWESWCQESIVSIEYIFWECFNLSEARCGCAF